ncbi:MAG: IclR family transcriptional regulator [Geminicoccaceae bacterium]
MSKRANDEPEPGGTRYSAPALEKGLDILELLAAEAQGLNQTQIAQHLDRSISEIFRMLVALERRGYVRRRDQDGSYALTMRLFELAHHHPPVDRLVSEALPEMRALAGHTGQSCHLAVYDGDRILIVAQAESPRSRLLLVKLGAGFPLADTASGRVLIAFQAEAERARRLERALCGADAAWTAEALGARIAAVLARGFEEARSDAVQGVSDLSCPIWSHRGVASAALTVPFMEMVGNPVSLEQASAALRMAAARISERLGRDHRRRAAGRPDGA